MPLRGLANRQNFDSQPPVLSLIVPRPSSLLVGEDYQGVARLQPKSSPNTGSKTGVGCQAFTVVSSLLNVRHVLNCYRGFCTVFPMSFSLKIKQPYLILTTELLSDQYLSIVNTKPHSPSPQHVLLSQNPHPYISLQQHGRIGIH